MLFYSFERFYTHSCYDWGSSDIFCYTWASRNENSDRLCSYLVHNPNMLDTKDSSQECWVRRQVLCPWRSPHPLQCPLWLPNTFHNLHLTGPPLESNLISCVSKYETFYGMPSNKILFCSLCRRETRLLPLIAKEFATNACNGHSEVVVAVVGKLC